MRGCTVQKDKRLHVCEVPSPISGHPRQVFCDLLHGVEVKLTASGPPPPRCFYSSKSWTEEPQIPWQVSHAVCVTLGAAGYIKTGAKTIPSHRNASHPSLLYPLRPCPK